jgi:hypothetical protein
MTLLHLPRSKPVFHDDKVDEDVFDRFQTILASSYCHLVLIELA